ncbi:MAG: hypothetical protein KAG98_01975 [Lentisphaeria bacterium]|nr:hypothetical protein [Lentisphaeria bacterium]
MKTLLALLLAGSVTFAQQSNNEKKKNNKNKSPEKRLAKLTKTLGLSDAQVSKIKTIQAYQKAERDLAEFDRSARMEKMKSERKSKMTNTHEKIKSLLNEDQQVKFTEFMKERRQEMNKKQGNGKKGSKGKGKAKKPNAKACLKKMTKALDLTKEQATNIAAIQKLQEAERELNQIEQKSRKTQKQAMRDQKMEKMKERIKSVLTPEQQEKFDAMHNERKNSNKNDKRKKNNNKKRSSRKSND